MAGHRLLYGAVLLCCGMLYLASGQWLAAMGLLMVLGLPWASLLLSLPGMLTFRLEIHCPAVLLQGEQGKAGLAAFSRFPLPPFRSSLRLTELRTGMVRRYDPDRGLPGEHCGAYRISLRRPRVYDALGLIGLPVKGQEKTFVVRPRPLEMKNLPDLNRRLAGTWRSKTGGGFGENHELRLYRPGDSLNQIHWKLTAKTGKLTIREPMEPRPGRILLTMNLRGTAEALDRKFGRLLWLGQYLCQREVAFELRVLGAEGVKTWHLKGPEELEKVLDALLAMGCAREGDLRDRKDAAAWYCHIGGDPDEGE